MAYRRVIVQHSGRWERSNYVDGEDQVVHIPVDEFSRDMLLNEIYEFMETSPLNVKYTLHYLIRAEDGRPLKGLLKSNADLARLVQEMIVPIVYVTEKVIQEPPTVDISHEDNEGPVGDDFIDEPSAQNSETEDDDYESELRRNQIVEFCEWIRESDHLDEFVNIIEHGGPRNFSSEQFAANSPDPNVGSSSCPSQWVIPVAHVDGALAVVEDGPPEIDIEALEVGSTFEKKDDLIVAVGKWHMQNQVEYGVSRLSKMRMKFVCKHKDVCSFKIYASAKHGLWKIKKCEHNHTCQSDLTRNAPRKMSSKVIANYFAKRLLRENEIIKSKAIIAHLLSEYDIEVEYNVALRARNLAVEICYGNHDQSYQTLPTYLNMLKISNPGTMYDVETTFDARFKYMFLALGVSLAAFSSYMRPVVVVDGTHLKGKNTGTLFVAVTKDGNEQCFPLGIGIGPIENDALWTWFLTRFRMTFGERDDLLIISDAHPSIKNAIESVYPNAAHGLCYYHMAKNLARYGGHIVSLF